MKRIITLLLALVFVLALFTACAGGTPAGSPDAGSATSAPTAAPATAKPTEAPSSTAAPAETAAPTEEPEPTEEPSPYKFASGKFKADRIVYHSDTAALGSSVVCTYASACHFQRAIPGQIQTTSAGCSTTRDASAGYYQITGFTSVIMHTTTRLCGSTPRDSTAKHCQCA